jgi:uncharacterized protein YndB with AHSA1/START domain
VPLSAEDAFALFTDRIASWWPLESHSVGLEEATTVVFESHVGGRIYEILKDGTEHEWGRVSEIERPDKVVFSWYPGRTPATAGEVEVHVRRSGDDSVVTLVHRGWEKMGERGRTLRENYDTGWDLVLGERYVGAAISSNRS